MYKNKKTGIIGIILTITILIAVVILSNINVQKMSYIENVVNGIVMPIQNGLTYLKNKISGNDGFFTNINYLQEENEALKKKNSELEQSLRELEIVKAENETLKDYVDLKEKYQEYKTVPGYVINKDISNYANNIVINIGEKDGVKPNMTVIGDKGLVGHVISTTQNTAKVETIIDTGSSVSCLISSTRDNMMANGMLQNFTQLKGTYIEPEATIAQGDVVETSGLGGIYPKGIPIGTISEIIETKNITNRYVIINTAVDFKKLETILVIV